MSGIDAMFEQDLGGSWSPTNVGSQPRSNSNHSLNNDPTGNETDEKDPDKIPAWSELKTKAGKDRKRLPLACIACRRKKIKCSGEKPACKHCLKARIPCVYKVTTRKAAPRTDYMAMLDKRLKRMEDRVIKIIPKEDMPDLNATGRSSVKPPIPGTAPKKDKNQAMPKRSAEEAFDFELNEWTKPNQAGGITSQPPKRQAPRDTENKLFTEGSESLPPQQIQEHLTEVFFDCVYGQSYLLLHKPSFVRKLKAGDVPPVLILAVCAISARFSTHPQVSTEPAFLRGEQWANAARSIVEKRHFEPNITILTVMLILGLHYFGTCEGGLSWSFGGQAMRMGYALQLHRELDHDPLGQAQAERNAASGRPELSFTDREIRRRTMWACYLMDTFNSSGTERPSFLSEDYLSIQLPIKESHFRMEIPGQTEDLEGHTRFIPSQGSILNTNEEQASEAKANMGVAAYVVRAVVLWKRIVKYLNLGGREKDPHPIWDPLSQFANLQRQITTLKASLPATLAYTAENFSTHINERLANQFIFLHVVLAQTNLFLHRFAIPTAPNTHRPYPPNTPKSFLATSATTVLEAAAQISKLLADSSGHTLTVPFAGYCAYASATVHVWGIFSRHANLEKTSRENLRHNYRYLNRMKRYWGMFHYMAESVKDTYRAFADAASRTPAQAVRNAMNQNQSMLGAMSIDPVESAAISAQGSRAASPTADSTGAGGAMTTEDDAGDGTEKQAGTGRPKMLQYGDWFDKYPHGVSESEWETTHLPHRSETQRGTEAVMSQRSDLQSVEEFFASLSPPSKAEEQELQNARGKKVAKKRGKSVAEEKSAGMAKGKDGSEGSQQRQSSLGAGGGGAAAATRKQSQSSVAQSPQQARMFGSTSMQHAPAIDLSSDIDIPMSNIAAGLQSGQGNSAFDLSSPDALFSQAGAFGSIAMPQNLSPFDYTSPTSASSNPGGSAAASQPQQQQQQQQQQPGMNFNFNYTSALPHLDRQMVFGGYAGIDPATSGSANALNNLGNFDFWSNPWDGNIDIDGFSGFNDSFGVGGVGNENVATENENTGGGSAAAAGGSNPGQAQQQSQPGLNSSAWFMPFNIEPPSYGIDDFSGLDAMDMSGSNFPDGSFSSPSGGDGSKKATRGSEGQITNLY